MGFNYYNFFELTSQIHIQTELKSRQITCM